MDPPSVTEQDADVSINNTEVGLPDHKTLITNIARNRIARTLMMNVRRMLSIYRTEERTTPIPSLIMKRVLAKSDESTTLDSTSLRGFSVIPSPPPPFSLQMDDDASCYNTHHQSVRRMRTSAILSPFFDLPRRHGSTPDVTEVPQTSRKYPRRHGSTPDVTEVPQKVMDFKK
ncbi:hypothetical protein BT69DRAFT_274289 [Atractiella rhizophila]|nr:hypothetical protein BT69DRAFT_274289 [Atractiella rhizophila]